MKLSENIKKYRKLNGLTLEGLANRVSCSKNYIWEIETGKKQNPSIKIVCEIADVLNVTVDELIALPLKRTSSEIDVFIKNFMKLDDQAQKGIIAQVNELIKIKQMKRST
jgi:transcriptional regulator with XRE-family HTH domain